MTPTLRFDGETFNPGLDRARLTGQLFRVYLLMADGHWRTLREISETTGGSEASVSARLRDLRKEKFGGHTVERQRRGEPKAGLWEYRLAVKHEQLKLV
jgi:DNA-binding transcriptional regulator GbsR (MarR family)